MMFDQLTISLDELKALDKEAAREIILGSFQASELDANELFAFASELEIELTIK
jgi:hypothetical protein